MAALMMVLASVVSAVMSLESRGRMGYLSVQNVESVRLLYIREEGQ